MKGEIHKTPAVTAKTQRKKDATSRSSLSSMVHTHTRARAIIIVIKHLPSHPNQVDKEVQPRQTPYGNQGEPSPAVLRNLHR